MSSEAVLGVDGVSQFDWQGARTAGVSFAFLLSTDGTTVEAAYAASLAAAQGAKIAVAPTHHFDFVADPSAQSDAFVGAVKSLVPGMLPPALKLDATGSHWQPKLQDNAETNIRLFLTLAEGRLKIPLIVYTSLDFWSQSLEISSGLADHPLWIADTSTDSDPTLPVSWGTWTFRQYALKQKLSHLPVQVNLNHFNGDAATFELFRIR